VSTHPADCLDIPPRYSFTRRPGYTQQVTLRLTYRPARVAFVPAGAGVSEMAAVLAVLERRELNQRMAEYWGIA
jgi:hypothetical protein